MGERGAGRSYVPSCYAGRDMPAACWAVERLCGTDDYPESRAAWWEAVREVEEAWWAAWAERPTDPAMRDRALSALGRSGARERAPVELLWQWVQEQPCMVTVDLGAAWYAPQAVRTECRRLAAEGVLRAGRRPWSLLAPGVDEPERSERPVRQWSEELGGYEVVSTREAQCASCRRQVAVGDAAIWRPGGRGRRSETLHRECAVAGARSSIATLRAVLDAVRDGATEWRALPMLSTADMQRLEDAGVVERRGDGWGLV